MLLRHILFLGLALLDWFSLAQYDCFNNQFQLGVDLWGPTIFDQMAIDYSEEAVYFGQMRTEPGSGDRFGQFGKIFLSNNSQAYFYTIREDAGLVYRTDILSIDVTTPNLVMALRMGGTTINTGLCFPLIGLFDKTNGTTIVIKRTSSSSSPCWAPGQVRLAVDTSFFISMLSRTDNDLKIHRFDMNLNYIKTIQNLETVVNDISKMKPASLVYDATLNNIYYSMQTNNYDKFGLGILHLGDETITQLHATLVSGYVNMEMKTFKLYNTDPQTLYGCIVTPLGIGFFSFNKYSQTYDAIKLNRDSVLYDGTASKKCIGMHVISDKLYIHVAQIFPNLKISRVGMFVINQTTYTDTKYIALSNPAPGIYFTPQNLLYYPPRKQWIFAGHFQRSTSILVGYIMIQQTFHSLLNYYSYDPESYTLTTLDDLVENSNLNSLFQASTSSTDLTIQTFVDTPHFSHMISSADKLNVASSIDTFPSPVFYIHQLKNKLNHTQLHPRLQMGLPILCSKVDPLQVEQIATYYYEGCDSTPQTMNYDVKDITNIGSPRDIMHLATTNEPYTLEVNCAQLYTQLGDRDTPFTIKVFAFTVVNNKVYANNSELQFQVQFKDCEILGRFLTSPQARSFVYRIGQNKQIQFMYPVTSFDTKCLQSLSFSITSTMVNASEIVSYGHLQTLMQFQTHDISLIGRRIRFQLHTEVRVKNFQNILSLSTHTPFFVDVQKSIEPTDLPRFEKDLQDQFIMCNQTSFYKLPNLKILNSQTKFEVQLIAAGLSAGFS